jgi:hypothetical protein
VLTANLFDCASSFPAGRDWVFTNSISKELALHVEAVRRINDSAINLDQHVMGLANRFFGLTKLKLSFLHNEH